MGFANHKSVLLLKIVEILLHVEAHITNSGTYYKLLHKKPNITLLSVCLIPEAVVGKCHSKQLFLKVSQISEEQHLCWSLFLIKLPSALLKRDYNAGVFL